MSKRAEGEEDGEYRSGGGGGEGRGGEEGTKQHGEKRWCVCVWGGGAKRVRHTAPLSAQHDDDGARQNAPLIYIYIQIRDG